MKKFFVCAIIALTVFAGAFAQDASAEQDDQILIKISVLDPEWVPKIYVAKYSNFRGKKLLCTGTGEGYVNNSYGYIGFSSFACQPVTLDKKVIEFAANKGNPGLHKLGIASALLGGASLGVGLGLMGVSYLEGEEEFKKQSEKVLKNNFDLNDLLEQMKAVKKLGPIKNLLKMIPGINKIDLSQADPEDELKKVSAIICSMTKQERENPDIIDASRKRRIANGCKRSVNEINLLLKRLKKKKKMMQMLKDKKFNLFGN